MRLGVALFILLVLSSVPTAFASLTVADKIEVLIFGCLLYYVDIVTDYWSNLRFWNQKRYWFFGANSFGIGVNWIAGMCIMICLSEGASAVGAVTAATQTHVLVYTIIKLCSGKDDENDDMMMVLRGFEFLEASCSTVTQGYDLVWDPDLTGLQTSQLRFSVMVSVLSLAKGLTLFDKAFGKIKSLFSKQFMLAFFFRLSEVILSFGSLFIFQLITRPYGIFMAQGTLCGTALMYTMWHTGKIDKDTLLERCLFKFFFILMAIPLSLYYTGPILVGELPDSHDWKTFAPPPTVYFMIRCVWCMILLAVAYHKEGSFAALWHTLNQYPQSAQYCAMAVVGAAAIYPISFLMVMRLWRVAEYEDCNVGN